MGYAHPNNTGKQFSSISGQFLCGAGGELRRGAPSPAGDQRRLGFGPDKPVTRANTRKSAPGNSLLSANRAVSLVGTGVLGLASLPGRDPFAAPGGLHLPWPRQINPGRGRVTEMEW